MSYGRGTSKKSSKVRSAHLGSGILANSVKESERKKLDCYGIFTVFWAWGYPCTRTWFTVITLFGLPKGATSITLSLRKPGSKSVKRLASADLKINEPNTALTLPIRTNHRFIGPGGYFIECSLRGSSRRIHLPFEVRTKKWPEFTEKEINFARRNPAISQSLRATVHCVECGHTYIFEETLVPELKLTGGVLRFPQSGELKCESCGHSMNLRDIQGQIRASLKESILQSMRGK